MLFVFAQEGGAPAGAQAQPQAGPSMMPTVLMLLGMGAIWWFLVISPQKKAEKARRAKLDALAKGDRVRTRGGIEGVVARVQDDVVVVKIDTDGKVQVPFAKAYIEDVLTDSSAETKESK